MNENKKEFLEDFLYGVIKTCSDYLENNDDVCNLDCPFYHTCARMCLKIRNYKEADE